LCFHPCNLGDEGAIILAKNSTLTKLGVPLNNIKGKGIKALAQSKTIRDLDVGKNFFDKESVEALARNKALTSLDIWTIRGTDNMLESFRGNSTLTSLKVSLFSHEDAKILATLPNLTHLDISWGGAVGSKTARFLTESRSLRSLNIAGNSLIDEDIAVLAEYPALTSLDVRRNNIDQEGIRSLAKNMALVHLDISENPGDDIWGEMVDIRLKLVQDRRSKLGNVLSSSLSHRLPSDLENLILDYELSRFTFRPRSCE
jgi:hypothetical protein